MEKEKLDKLTAALDSAGYKIIGFQMEEHSYMNRPTAITDEDKRLTGTINLRIRPVTSSFIPLGKE